MAQEEFTSFIYLRLQDSPLSGDFGQLDSWKSLLPHTVHFYELDNFSDEVSFAYGKQLAEQATQICLLVDVQACEELGKTMGFINAMLKHSQKVYGLLLGNNPLVHKVLKKAGGLGFVQFEDEEAAKKWISAAEIH